MKISIAAAAQIAGVHAKTIERYIKETEGFQEAVGYRKNPINGRITLEEDWFRTHLAAMSGDDSMRSPDHDIIDGEVVTGHELEKTSPGTAIERRGPNDASSGASAEQITRAFMMPHKIMLTLAEAAQLSGLSRSTVRAYCHFIGGRWQITRTGLELAVQDVWKKTAKAKPPSRTFGKPVPKKRRAKK